MDLFHKEHSIPFKEALVFSEGELVYMFIKERNLQCYPIYPRHNPQKNR